MTLQDSFILAWRTVKSNKLRTGITVAIIAFGIMALIGIITAISAMNQSLKENFSFMGATQALIRKACGRISSLGLYSTQPLRGALMTTATFTKGSL